MQVCHLIDVQVEQDFTFLAIWEGQITYPSMAFIQQLLSNKFMNLLEGIASFSKKHALTKKLWSTFRTKQYNCADSFATQVNSQAAHQNIAIAKLLSPLRKLLQ